MTKKDPLLSMAVNEAFTKEFRNGSSGTEEEKDRAKEKKVPKENEGGVVNCLYGRLGTLRQSNMTSKE